MEKGLGDRRAVMKAGEEVVSWEKDWSELTEEDILWANIKKYENEEVVKFYDDENGAGDIQYLEHEIIFPIVIDHLWQSKGRELKAIDVCGGAGKAAFILAKCGKCQTVLLDSADKMLDIARRKIAKEGITSVQPLRDDALSYLKNTSEIFDLVVFSSAIHHFKEPANLIGLAFSRLAEEGVIVILGEPHRLVSSKRYKRAFALYAFLTHAESRREFLRSLPKRIAGTYQPPDYRDPAEYHAHIGIDDAALKRDLIKQGMEVLVHFHYPAGGPPHIVRLQPYLGLNWVLGMVVSRRPDGQLKTAIENALKKKLPYRIDIL